MHKLHRKKFMKIREIGVQKTDDSRLRGSEKIYTT